jgi:hypothetical protein
MIVSSIASIAATANATGSRQYCDGYYYDLTSDSPADIPVGAEVTVNAVTNDPRGYKVIFYWKSPSDETIPIGDLLRDPDHDGEKLASSTMTLSEAGEWTVYAVFWDQVNVWCIKIKFPVAIRCIRFNVIPEAPLIGTAGVSIVMMLGLAFTMKRRAQKANAIA